MVFLQRVSVQEEVLLCTHPLTSISIQLQVTAWCLGSYQVTTRQKYYTRDVFLSVKLPAESPAELQKFSDTLTIEQRGICSNPSLNIASPVMSVGLPWHCER